MKINDKILSIPPYISTSWNNVQAIQMKGSFLVITLNNGETINIPGLNSETIETIFNIHASIIEKREQFFKDGNQKISPNTVAEMMMDQGGDTPLRFGFNSLDGMGSVLQHNPEQMNAPDLPKQIIQKITAIAKIVAPEDILSLPKPEPHCNCIHCQIARAIHSGILPEEHEQKSQNEEENVTEQDLQFSQWEITQSGEKLFTVANRLDSNEKYSVYLGHPIGCTCGKSGCEHIIAVLKS